MRKHKGSHQTASRNWRHGSCPPTVGLTECPHCLRQIGYRSDCDWTGISLSSLCVIAESGSARYFQSVFFACRLSAGHGVPLYTLILITQRECIWRIGIPLPKSDGKLIKKPITFPTSSYGQRFPQHLLPHQQ